MRVEREQPNVRVERESQQGDIGIRIAVELRCFSLACDEDFGRLAKLIHLVGMATSRDYASTPERTKPTSSSLP